MKKLFVFLMMITLISGCGYTRKSMLPDDIKTIYVETVENKIPPSEIIAYQVGLEMDITNAVIRRLHRDGNLKVVSQDSADVLLRTKLTGYEQEGVRFSRLETVQEFRVFIVVSMELINNKTGEVIWAEPNFSGDSEYFVSHVRSINREDASAKAIDRLAVNMVDRIVEDW
ncbi:MAG: LptE family protein [Candidatus Omnitrophica bacterium]|nr:LptE family protein [Candidatus Omnitrophota bacterium]